MNAIGLAFACTACLIAPARALGAELDGDWWVDRVSMSGDLRLRHESIRRQPGEDDERQRYRGRFGITLDASDAIELGVQLATGDGSLVSANLDFGESVGFDNIRIDRAYLAWSASDAVDLIGGKMKNPLYRAGDNALIWDSDLNPEGFAAKVESAILFGRVGAFILDERDNGVESWLYAAQAGATLGLAESSTFTAGIGWFDYTDIAGNSSLFGDDTKGNSVDAAGNYLYDYDIVEVFARYDAAVAGWPVTVFAEWAQNSRAANADMARSVGINIGRAEEAGTLALSWAWRHTEADALVGIFTDSDFADGNTDSRGHILEGTYMVTEHVGVGATLIFSQHGGFADTPTDFDRAMFDIEFSF